MTETKDELLLSLRQARSGLLRGVEGLGEYEIRRPMTPTGTNLLGLVKHVASVQLGYLGDVFGRPSSVPLPWFSPRAAPDDDLWVPATQSTAEILELHRLSAEHADATVEALALDAPGLVPWWPEGRREVTLHRILVHLIVETARHAGHADILRELVSGAAGRGPDDQNLTPRTSQDWAEHRARIEAGAREAAGR